MISIDNIKVQAGVSLIEILVAALILGGGALGVASLQLTGLKYVAGSQARTQATLLATDMLDRMRSNEELARSGSNYNTGGFKDAHNAAKNCFTDDCDPDEMVDFDKSKWLERVSSLLPNGQGRIEGLDTPDDQRIIVITLQWRRFNETEDGDDIDQFEQLVFRGAI